MPRVGLARRDSFVRKWLLAEITFLMLHLVYLPRSTLYSHLEYLAYTSRCSMFIAQILMHHIRDCLPEIKSKLNVMIQSVTQELMELGEPTDCASHASLGATLVCIRTPGFTRFRCCKRLSIIRCSEILISTRRSKLRAIFSGSRLWASFFSCEIVSMTVRMINPNGRYFTRASI